MRVRRWSLQFLLLLLTTSYSGTFGVPQYLWCGTWALRYQSDPCGAPELPRSLLHRDKFISTLQSKITSSGYSIGFNHYLNYEDTYACIDSFYSSRRDMCEVVFFCGHGNTLSQLSFRDGTACQYARYFQYGGTYTKWAFLEACNFFRYDRNGYDYSEMFNGAHAIFGYASQYGQFYKNVSSWWDCLWSGCHYIKSEDRWAYFWNNWFSGQSMWYAYRDAIINSQNEFGVGVEPAVVMLFGYVTDDNSGQSQEFWGGMETVTNTYSSPLYPSQLGLAYVSVVSGNPIY